MSLNQSRKDDFNLQIGITENMKTINSVNIQKARTGTPLHNACINHLQCILLATV
jgi:hypothetical protein